MKKSTVYVASLGLILGLYSPAMAGNVPPPGGGNQDVSTNSSWGPDWANGSVSGPLITQQMSAGIWTSANPDPKPGNLGTFNMNFSASGIFYHPGDPVPDSQPPQVSASLRANSVHSEHWGDGGTIIYFDPMLDLSSRGNGGFWIDPNPGYFSGWLSGNLGVVGGKFTDVSANFQENHWTGDGPRPSWLTDWNAYFNASGIITATNFTVVPEPATLTLAAIGGLVTFRLRRRKQKHQTRNLIA